MTQNYTARLLEFSLGSRRRVCLGEKLKGIARGGLLFLWNRLPPVDLQVSIPQGTK